MCRGIKNEKGSASVLVILIMISLITFGLLAMLLSNSDYKMAKKNAKWLKQQYEIESQAAQAEAALDVALDSLTQTQQSGGAEEAQLLSAAGQKVESMAIKGQSWHWQPFSQLAVCEVAANADGQAMTLGFKIWVVPNGNEKRLTYDVVAWRATRQ